MNSSLFIQKEQNVMGTTLIAWMLGTATIHIKPLIDASKNITQKKQRIY